MSSPFSNPANPALRIVGLLVVLGTAGLLAYLGYGDARTAPRGAAGEPPPVPLADGDGPTLAPEELKRLLVQIVDTEGKEDFVERAVIEGRPFKYFLQRVSRLTAEQIRKQVDDRLTFEQLGDEPDLHRGAPYAAGRGVIVEIARADLTPDYNFPAGWTVLPGVFINTAKEVYGVRFLCPPGSTLYERLKGGIDNDSLPVIQVSGLFFKSYARRTNSVKEPPWVGPLLVCPEPEFPANVEPRHVLTEIKEAGYGHLLPSQRIDAPKTEERLVFEVSHDEAKRPGDSDAVKPILSFEGQKSPLDSAEFLESAVQDFIKRQPKDALMPAAVVLVRDLRPDAPLFNGLRATFRKLGVSRICIKTDFTPPAVKPDEPAGVKPTVAPGK